MASSKKFSALHLGIKKAVKSLEERENAQDELLKLTRELVRACSVSIKCMHSKELGEAKKKLAEVESFKQKIDALSTGFKNLIAQSLQEYVEARLFYSLINDASFPTHLELKVPFEVYLTGLMDCVGELRREMLEELKHGNKKRAEQHFDSMNEIYEATLPLRFSNSLLPNFRKKQDVARSQVEQARSELLYHLKK
ncbi:MAG: hypothetical protein ABIH99_00060 [Candidatus Micrarchaeota archaeon]